jgi:hypothetical protein
MMCASTTAPRILLRSAWLWRQGANDVIPVLSHFGWKSFQGTFSLFKVFSLLEALTLIEALGLLLAFRAL